MSDNQITESQFLSPYLEGVMNKVEEYKKLIKNDSNLDVSHFTENCIDYRGSLSYFLKFYVVDLMKENNLDLSHPIYQSSGTFVPMANYLQLRSFGHQLKALKELDNFINQTLEESYPPENLDQE